MRYNPAFRPLKGTVFSLPESEQRHPAEAECRLLVCCPILFDRCRFRNSFKLLSYQHPGKAVFFLNYLYLLFQFFRMVILQEKHIIHRIRQLLPLQKRRKLFLESLWKISGICGWKITIIIPLSIRHFASGIIISVLCEIQRGSARIQYHSCLRQNVHIRNIIV